MGSILQAVLVPQSTSLVGPGKHSKFFGIVTSLLSKPMLEQVRQHGTCERWKDIGPDHDVDLFKRSEIEGISRI